MTRDAYWNQFEEEMIEPDDECPYLDENAEAYNKEVWDEKQEKIKKLIRGIAYLLFVYKDALDNVWRRVQYTRPPHPWTLMNPKEALIAWVIQEGKKDLANTARTLFFMCIGSGITIHTLKDDTIERMTKTDPRFEDKLNQLFETVPDYKTLEAEIIEEFPILQKKTKEEIAKELLGSKYVNIQWASEHEEVRDAWKKAEKIYYNNWDEYPIIPQPVDLTLDIFQRITGQELFSISSPITDADGVFDVMLMDALNEVKEGGLTGYPIVNGSWLPEILGVSRQRVSQMIQEGKLKTTEDGRLEFKTLLETIIQKATPLDCYTFKEENGAWYPTRWLPPIPI